MNLVYLRNMVFFLSPYLFMALYDVAPKIPFKLRMGLTASFWIGCFVIFVGAIGVLFTRGLVIDNRNVTTFLTIPTYLVFFYLVCIFVTFVIYASWRSGDVRLLRSTCVAFMISYFNSFYWEVPENIFWQIKRGYHPTIIFTVLGAFPYIWLNSRLRWKKSKEKVAWLLFGWLVTTLTVLTVPSNLDTTIAGTWIFLGVRVICYFSLLMVFVFNSYEDLVKFSKWFGSLFGSILCAFLVMIKDWLVGSKQVNP